jgi:4-hydroxybenzoate polyprenyltransferase
MTDTPSTAAPAVTAAEQQVGDLLRSVAVAMRPTQWVKNGLLFAGLIFGAKLFDVWALKHALVAFVTFCLLCSGFYLINDVRDAHADRLHPLKRFRPIASGALSAVQGLQIGIAAVLIALAVSLWVGRDFFLVTVAYAALMVAYNVGLKDFVIVDVMVIAFGFVLRAIAGAIAVDVSISSWLLICTALLALVVGFGKRRHELITLAEPALHRPNLDQYSTPLLDQLVAVTAGGTLLAYAMYTVDGDSVPADRRMMLTIPLVAYAIFRYLFLVYQRGHGGSPETTLLTDRLLLATGAAWCFVSSILQYVLS